MIIKITHVLNSRRTLELELISKDVETHSYLDDRPDLQKMIIDLIRNTLTSYSFVHDIKDNQ